MRRLLSSLLASALAAAPLVAQTSCPNGYSFVTLNKAGALSPLTTGTLTVVAHDASGNPQAFSMASAGVELAIPKIDPIAKGALANTLCLPRTDLSSIAIAYHFIIRDTSKTGGNRVVLDADNVPIRTNNFSLDSYNFVASATPYVLDNTSFAGLSAAPQVPVGSVDGNNLTFTLSTTSTAGFLYRNGLLQRLNTDYSFTGNTITFTTAPQPGDDLSWTPINVTAQTGGGGMATLMPVLKLPITDSGNGATLALEFLNGSMKLVPYVVSASEATPPSSYTFADASSGGYTLRVALGALKRTP